MQQYDIRIQRKGGASEAVSARLASDVQALQRADRLAGDDDELEVWRGAECIYRREILPRRHPLAC